jgi:hypothetical protein
LPGRSAWTSLAFIEKNDYQIIFKGIADDYIKLLEVKINFKFQLDACLSWNLAAINKLVQRRKSRGGWLHSRNPPAVGSWESWRQMRMLIMEARPRMWIKYSAI